MGCFLIIEAQLMHAAPALLIHADSANIATPIYLIEKENTQEKLQADSTDT